MPESDNLVEQVLAGNRRALARLISLVEDGTPEANEAISVLYSHTGSAYTIGVTGAPGTGKSCLVTELVKHLRTQDKRVAVVAVDPSSPFTGGALLGDRFRMRDLAGDPGVFIRSMATRGQLGGVARATFDVMRVLDAAGFDYVIVETVGAGQNEVEIARVADTVVLVDAPGMGDDIQAIKAGILEIADVIVVNKADRPGVKNTVRALKAMLELGHRKREISHHGQVMIQTDGFEKTLIDDRWQVPVLQTIATQGEGIEELAQAVLNHAEYLSSTGIQAERDRVRLQNELINRLRDRLVYDLLQRMPSQDLEKLVTAIAARELDPASAVQSLVSNSKHE